MIINKRQLQNSDTWLISAFRIYRNRIHQLI